MKPAPFDYCRADTLDEALDLLAEYGADGAVLAGGLSLGAMLNMRLARPGAVIDINRVPDLDGVDTEGDQVITGALLRQADAMRHDGLADVVPLLAEAMPHVGHFQTRNRGTLGGSAAHADPSAEIPLSLVTLGGEIVLKSKARERRVPAREFFVSILTTEREPDELLTALVWPSRRARTGYAFEEIAQRHGDFAITAAAAMAEVRADGTVESVSLGLGGVEDRPFVADMASFTGASATAETAVEIAEAAAAAAEPMEDVQANGDYRRQLVRVLGARALSRAFERAAAGT